MPRNSQKNFLLELIGETSKITGYKINQHLKISYKLDIIKIQDFSSLREIEKIKSHATPTGIKYSQYIFI